MTEPFAIIPAGGRAASTLFPDVLRGHLDRDGAVLMRGCNVESLPALLDAARVALGATYEYKFFVTPRRPVESGFMSATDLPPARGVRFHNECSYLPSMPRYLLFVCRKPSDTGGQTLLARTRDVARALPQPLRDAFASRSVSYRWQLNSGEEIARKLACASVQDAIATLTALGADARIDERGHLEVQIVRPAVIQVASEPSWVNHVWALHRSAVPSVLRDVYTSQYGADYAPHDARFADGSPIEEDDVEAIGSAYKASTVPVEWQAGDVLVFDNLRWAHGREPFTGTRDVCVALFGANRIVTRGTIVRLVQHHLSRAGVSATAIDGLSFTQAGGDSVAAAEIIEAVRCGFGIQVPIARFFGGTSITDLADEIVKMAQR